MTFLESVGDHLAANGYGTLGTSLFLGRQPAAPDDCTTIFEYEGRAPAETFGAAATAIDYPRLQVMCRAGRDDYPGARDRAVTIRAFLGAITDETISGVRILRIRPNGSVLPLGPDENDRPIVVVNFEVAVLP